VGDRDAIAVATGTVSAIIAVVIPEIAVGAGYECRISVGTGFSFLPKWELVRLCIS
jgi:hypothetical protein